MIAQSASTDSILDSTLMLENVHAVRGGNEILKGISCQFLTGSRTTIIGPSGSGKSTLLRLMNRLIEPSHGTISLGGVSIAEFPPTTLRRTIGLVLQAPRPLPGTLADNLNYPTSLGHGRSKPTISLEASLEEVGLDFNWLKRDAHELSGGERQRLAIAVALRTNPRILLLDEPTSALDPQAAKRVSDVLRDRSVKTGLTTISVTHNRDQTPWLGDRTVALEAGRIVDNGPTTEVLNRVDTSFWSAEAQR
jgi:putative ABC transport system ATP-binding protein